MGILLVRRAFSQAGKQKDVYNPVCENAMSGGSTLCVCVELSFIPVEILSSLCQK
jgi:hypothetical protein